MSTEEIPMSAVKTAAGGLAAGVVAMVIARIFLTIPTLVCVVGVLIVLALAVAYAAGVRDGGATDGR